MRHYAENNKNKVIYIQFDDVKQKDYVVSVCKQSFELLSIADKTISYNEVLKAVLLNGVKDLERYINEQKGGIK